MSATKLVLKSTTSTSLNDRFSQIMGSRRTEEPTRVKKSLKKCRILSVARQKSEFPNYLSSLLFFYSSVLKNCEKTRVEFGLSEFSRARTLICSFWNGLYFLSFENF